VTRNNLHPSYTALPKNSESWRINLIYQTSKEICANSPRASNEWLFSLTRKADSVRLGRRRNRVGEGETHSEKMRQTVAPGTRYLTALLDNQKQFRERLGDNPQWKNRRPILRHPTASIIGTWRVSCGNWLVNSVSPARAKSYLTLPRDTSEEPIA
jgi:hypothetical protein